MRSFLHVSTAYESPPPLLQKIQRGNVERERNDHVTAVKAETLKLIVQSPKAPKLLSPFLDEALEQTSIEVPICSLTRFRFALNLYRYFSLIAAARLAFDYPENSNTKDVAFVAHYIFSSGM
ncbi:hypothetical protein Tco_0514577 [Tanacetum coccineum]